MKKLTARQLVARGPEEESQSKQRTHRSPRKSTKHLKGCIPLALLPKEGAPGEGKGQGMTPSSIPNLYKDSWGNLCNSQGMMVDVADYDCLVCFDAHRIKIDPRDIGRVSEGAWHSILVPCSKWDKETKRCAV